MAKAPTLSRVIPAEHHAEVMRLRGAKNPATTATWTAKEVAAHLLATHGVRCSRMAVLRLEARISDRGDALLVQALRDEMRDAVGPMKARLVKASKKLSRKITTEKDTGKVAAGVRALTGVVDSLAKLGGVAAPTKHEVGVTGLAEFLSAGFPTGSSTGTTTP